MSAQHVDGLIGLALLAWMYFAFVRPLNTAVARRLEHERIKAHAQKDRKS